MPDMLSIDSALGASVAKTTKPGIKTRPVFVNKFSSLRPFSSVTDTLVDPVPEPTPPRKALRPPSILFCWAAATTSIVLAYTGVSITFICRRCDDTPKNLPTTMATTVLLGAKTSSPIIAAPLPPFSTMKFAELAGSVMVCPLVSAIARCSWACSYCKGEDPPIGASVVASITSDPGYSGCGDALLTSLSNAASSTATSATTVSCWNETWTLPVPTPASVTALICLAVGSTSNMPWTSLRLKIVRGSDVTSIVRPLYSSSTIIRAFVDRPACTATSPGTAKRAGDAAFAGPTMRTRADVAFGSETFAKAYPVPSNP